MPCSGWWAVSSQKWRQWNMACIMWFLWTCWVESQQRCVGRECALQYLYLYISPYHVYAYACTCCCTLAHCSTTWCLLTSTGLSVIAVGWLREHHIECAKVLLPISALSSWFQEYCAKIREVLIWCSLVILDCQARFDCGTPPDWDWESWVIVSLTGCIYNRCGIHISVCELMYTCQGGSIVQVYKAIVSLVLCHIQYAQHSMCVCIRTE